MSDAVIFKHYDYFRDGELVWKVDEYHFATEGELGTEIQVLLWRLCTWVVGFEPRRGELGGAVQRLTATGSCLAQRIESGDNLNLKKRVSNALA